MGIFSNRPEEARNATRATGATLSSAARAVTTPSRRINPSITASRARPSSTGLFSSPRTSTTPSSASNAIATRATTRPHRGGRLPVTEAPRASRTSHPSQNPAGTFSRNSNTGSVAETVPRVRNTSYPRSGPVVNRPSTTGFPTASEPLRANSTSHSSQYPARNIARSINTGNLPGGTYPRFSNTGNPITTGSSTNNNNTNLPRNPWTAPRVNTTHTTTNARATLTPTIPRGPVIPWGYHQVTRPTPMTRSTSNPGRSTSNSGSRTTTAVPRPSTTRRQTTSRTTTTTTPNNTAAARNAARPAVTPAATTTTRTNIPASSTPTAPRSSPFSEAGSPDPSLPASPAIAVSPSDSYGSQSYDPFFPPTSYHNSFFSSASSSTLLSYTRSPATAPATATRQYIEGECSICLDDLLYEWDDNMYSVRRNDPLVWCRNQCGSNFHASCIDRWFAVLETASSMTCPICRARWAF
ncbi:hypothetical protein BO70DRAFT_58963 [Aspergillus heteromorphus CBS 117.55]|uniref:RING-type domain-containing protein n=1 Tax=Aspergillus heteromorphus CBS 117.55 TaxID=1448321 RepID=A0A317W2A5_9EURO|nr:uncharacterized protein BO70DRAFT_58963 [Aspergillus heteromorphus CBS 117.55]PWY79318.1 hypothetical protein BO70DRAFT_58963 [Aspergillus heteromorphus CBS 117.55]